MDLSLLQTARQRASAYLIDNKKDGFWSYGNGNEPSIEATSWCAIALRRDVDSRLKVSQYLARVQNEDGGWSTAPATGKSDWNSALALLALRILGAAQMGEHKQPLSTGSHYLEDHRATVMRNLSMILVFLVEGPSVFAKPCGWPWNEGCFHWIEPTSYSLLALKPMTAQNQSMRSLIEEANEYVLSRHCKAGGWNHGDYKPLGFDSLPYAVTTAQALSALQDLPDNPTVLKALTFLEESAAGEKTTMTLAWSIMALNIFGRQTDELLARLLARQQQDGSFNASNMLTALAVCSMDAAAGDNPLKFTHKTGHHA